MRMSTGDSGAPTSLSYTCSNVSRAEYDFDEPEFDEITESAKDFISSLLVKDAKKRLSSEQALE